MVGNDGRGHICSLNCSYHAGSVCDEMWWMMWCPNCLVSLMSRRDFIGKMESIWNCWEDIVWPALAEQVVALTREARAHISWDFFRLLMNLWLLSMAHGMQPCRFSRPLSWTDPGQNFQQIWYLISAVDLCLFMPHSAETQSGSPTHGNEISKMPRVDI